MRFNSFVLCWLLLLVVILIVNNSFRLGACFFIFKSVLNLRTSSFVCAETRVFYVTVFYLLKCEYNEEIDAPFELSTKRFCVVSLSIYDTKIGPNYDCF